MKISFTPQRSDIPPLQVSKLGDIPTINGKAFDFGPLSEGEILPASAVVCPYVAGDVSRVEGELQIMLILPHGASPPKNVAFPDPIINPPDGDVQVPA
jgi:hypothetical protein